MKRRTIILNFLWLAGLVAAQEESPSQVVVTLTGTNRVTTGADATPTLSLSEIPTSIIATGEIPSVSMSIDSANATASTSTSSEDELTVIGDPTGTTTLMGNMTSTSTSARPTNTQPCNNYPEFCYRRYSNITEVCAHNSPFVRKNNAGANQEYGVVHQLNDGIRMLQGQTHLVNGTLHYCHTSCDLLDAGTVEDYLREVAGWVETHPFDVITILIGNGDYELTDSSGNPLVTSSNYVEPITNAGLLPYIYQPPKTAMNVSDWPTLGELIISGKRVIMFIDYNFDTDAVPWMLWEFYNIWETPYSPTDAGFPCTLGRPAGISEEKMRSMMFMANHNLNVDVRIADIDLLIPNTVELNVTNGLNGSGSLGAMTNECTSDWGRPPNFLLVDYYDRGSFPGSVFEVAARANNVTYNRNCCGKVSLAASTTHPSAAYLGLIIAVAVGLIL
ncbi:hypothetical protein CC78DRAFT_552326 [Lojkania enalia]|uniref:PLC-like phosphodiesterase n=1 Tax=Lojkania enalia TaxID=147567 RepID=A0A9P4KDN2_9PLEO|nr:hypothetical protein CC78DRAFT_552326 [Didymosphaeria enalia]